MATNARDMDQARPNGGERLQDAASGLIDQAGRTAETQASRTMTKAGETLDQVARAVREAGSGLRGERPEIAEFADTAAGRVEDAAQYLRVHDAGELIDEATRFARQQPVLVVGGALLAGLAIGRLLKSSTAMGSGVRAGMYGRSDYGSSDYGRSASGSGGYDARSSGGYAGASSLGATSSRPASARSMSGSTATTPSSTTTRRTSAATTGSPSSSTAGQASQARRSASTGSTNPSGTTATRSSRTSGGSAKEL